MYENIRVPPWETISPEQNERQMLPLSIGSIQTQQKLEPKRPKSVLNYKTKRNTKQTPWNMIKHDQTDKFGTAPDSRCMFCLFDLILYVPVNNLSVTNRDGSSLAEPV